MTKTRYRVFEVENPEKRHPDNRWYVYDYLDGAIARLRDGSLAYVATRKLAYQVLDALQSEPVWTPIKPTYGSLLAFQQATMLEDKGDWEQC